MRLEQGLHHVEGFLRVAVDVHQAPVLLVGASVVWHATAFWRRAPHILLVRVSSLPPTVGEREHDSPHSVAGVGQHAFEQVARGVGLRALVDALFVAQLGHIHVAVCTQFGEVHGLVAELGEV